MRHASFGDHFDTQRSLGRDRDPVFGGLAIHQKFASRRVLVCHFRAQAVALLADHKEQSDVNAFLVQPFRGCHLDGDDSLGVAGAASIHARSVFGRWNEWRDRIHVGGENNRGPRLLGEHREHIAARAFDRNFFRLKASPEQFGVKEIAHRAFVAGDGLDVHELAGKGDDIHARQDTLVPGSLQGLPPCPLCPPWLNWF